LKKQGDAMKKEIIKLIKSFYLQVLFVFLAFAAMVVVSNYYVRRIVREQMSSYSEKTISSAEYEIMSILSQYEITLNDFAFSAEFMIADGSTQEEIQAFFIKWTKWLYSNQEKFKGFTGLYGYIWNEYIDGLEWKPPDDYVIQSRPWYVGATANRGASFYTEPYIDMQSKSIIVSISRCINDGNENDINVISIDIDIADIIEYMDNLNIANYGYGVM
jgi:hypothetical protein